MFVSCMTQPRLALDHAVFDVQVKRCNEMARRLRFFHEQVTGASIPLQSPMLDAGVDLDELEV